MEVICIAPDFLSGLRRRRYNLMTRLARHGKVLYIDPFVSRRELASSRRDRIPFIAPELSGALSIPDLHAMSPFYPLPFHRCRSVAIVNELLVWRSLKTAARKRGFRRPILWVHNLPDIEKAIGRFDESLVCYDVFDKTSAYAPFSHRQSVQAEDRHIRLLKRADVVFAVSPKLYEDCARHSLNVHLVPNGVDVALFNRALANKTSVPNDICAINRPIVGYLGAIYDKIDFRLLTHLAQSRPDWSIVLIGPEWVTQDVDGFNCLKQQPNVFFLGEKQQEQLPAYMRAIDVGIVPYKAAYHVPFISPLKLPEYLAAGIPTVVSGFEPESDYRGIVEVVSEPSAFVATVRKLMEGDNTVRIQNGISVASRNSWDRRVEQIREVFRSRLAGLGQDSASH